MNISRETILNHGFYKVRDAIEKKMLKLVIIKGMSMRGNARILGISRGTMQSLFKKHKIREGK